MRTFLISSLILLIAAGCDVDPPVIKSPEVGSPTVNQAVSTVEPILIEVQIPAGYGARSPWLEVYFTDPDSPLAPQLTGGIDKPLVDSIDSARLSVDMAIYSLSLNSIRNALLRAHDRGVQVRLVVESDNLDRSDIERLREAGIPMLGDRREGLMHNKFVVIDNSEVWTGSMNFTDSGAYQDHNNLIRIRSETLAEDYRQEFDEMFVQDKFGPDVVPNTSQPRVIIEGTPVDVYFSPDDNVQAGILDLIDNARESIYFMAFSFTADPIGQALRDQAGEGLIVSGVMDSDQINSNIGTEFDTFRQAGVDVLRDGGKGQMHHKVMIIDESIVILGSYNFTNSAETRNDENLLVIYDPQAAAFFMAEFERVYSQSQ